MREKFEEWYMEHYGQYENDPSTSLQRDETGHYVFLGPRMCWQAWTQSRYCIDMCLPASEEILGHNMMYVSEVKDMLDDYRISYF